jgi:hypothetical protein
MHSSAEGRRAGAKRRSDDCFVKTGFARSWSPLISREYSSAADHDRNR